MASIDELSIDDDYDDGYIRTNNIKDIQDGNHVNSDVNPKYNRFKVCDRRNQEKSEWKGTELSEKSIRKGLHKVIKAVVNESNNSFPTLV